VEKILRLILGLHLIAMGLGLGWVSLFSLGWGLVLGWPIVAIIMIAFVLAGGEMAFGWMAPKGRTLEMGFVTMLLLFGPPLLWLGDCWRKEFPDVWLLWVPLLGAGGLSILAPVITLGRRRRRKNRRFRREPGKA
jgi:hypothetical protein